MPGSHPTALSIIVPVGPDETAWTVLVPHFPPRGDLIELIVSATTPPPAGLRPDIVWVQGPAGRARQLNLGARHARGRWLWFVHADCRPSADALAGVLGFIRDDPVAIGYCRLKFLDDGPRAAHLNALGANLRCRLLSLPYGDQGLCLSRQRFRALGGFDESMPRGEDLALVLRARRAGLRPRAMSATLATSARRYGRHGWLATTWRHQCLAWRIIRNAGHS